MAVAPSPPPLYKSLKNSAVHFTRLFGSSKLTMNQQYGDNQDQVSVVGFEVPNSPEASYNNVYPRNEDEGRGEPPMLPAHLQHSLLGHSNPCGSLPSPQNVTINHLYIENREAPRSVVALGVTHRFRSKFVTVVLYKPVPRR